jgi:hypothetical protein
VAQERRQVKPSRHGDQAPDSHVHLMCTVTKQRDRDNASLPVCELCVQLERAGTLA